MARRKRKYTRHKVPRQDTVPLSSVIVGLLPIVLMAGLVGAYVMYQYTDILRLTAIPPLPTIQAVNPDIHLPSVSLPEVHFPTLHVPDMQPPEIHMPELSLPEVTVSFDDVFQAFGAFGMVILDTLMSASERTMQLVGQAGAWGGGMLQSGGKAIVSGITWIVVSTQLVVVQLHSASIAYIRTLTWTVNDFIVYLDLPGKGQTVLDTILWPLHFLDPRPAMHAASEKTNETSQAVARFFAPFMPVLDYIWKSIQETAAELWKGIVDAITFLTWLTSQGNK